MSQFNVLKEQSILNSILEKYGLVAEFIEGAGGNDSLVMHVIIWPLKKELKEHELNTFLWVSSPHFSWAACMNETAWRLSLGFCYSTEGHTGYIRFPSFKTPTELKMKLELTGDT